MNMEPSLKELYEKRRYENLLLRKERIAQVYEKCPALKALDLQQKELSIARGRSKLSGQEWDETAYQQEREKLQRQRSQLLTELGYPGDYLEEIYTCPKCHDMGYYNGDRCSCFWQWKADLLFRHSPIRQQMERENFETFDFSLYSNEVTPPYPVSPRENIRTVYETARQFVTDFPNGTNLLIHGTTGVGKTFLTNCIAGELLHASHMVTYLSATRFFEILADHTFHRDSQKESEERYQFLTESELLIIDDLGTEINNGFVGSALFNCLNQRHLEQKSTIISTNLSMKQLEENYSKRVASRIMEQYHVLPVFGKDIRLKKGING